MMVEETVDADINIAGNTEEYDAMAIALVAVPFSARCFVHCSYPMERWRNRSVAVKLFISKPTTTPISTWPMGI